MTTHDMACREIVKYSAERGIQAVVSGVYDLFPDKPRVAPVVPDLCWPARWPHGRRHGVYLLFSDSTEGPELLYIGKSSGASSCLRARLNGYVDLAAHRETGQCVLREEWNGYHRPWGSAPRYVVTVALESDSASGDCPEAVLLEAHLIRSLRPRENIAGQLADESVDE